MQNSNEFSFNKIVNYQEKKSIESDPVIKELLEKIRELAHSENSIGKGATAEVFISKTNPDICYKIMHNDGEYKFRHSVYDEGELLAKAEKISKSTGIKIPMPYYSLSIDNENGNKFEALVMERLHATSVRDILNDNLAVPENFDFKSFTSKVENFFSKLNNQKIYHRDAHGGNIMLENETGAPCVIDFGASVYTPLSSENPYQQTNFQGETLIFTPDEQKIRQELRINLRGYLFKKYGNIHNL